jgi:ATP-binding cassette, subfamily B, bacterial
MKDHLKRWFGYFKSSISKELPEDVMKRHEEYPKIGKILKYFSPIFKKHWKLAVLCAALPSLSMLINLPAPMVTRYLVDNVILAKNMSLLLPVLIVLGSLKLLPLILTYVMKFFNLRFERSLTIDLTKMILEKLTALPKSFFDKNKTGYIMSRTMANVQTVKWFFGDVYSSSFNTIVSFVAGLSFLFYLEWRLTVVLLAAMPFSFLGTRFIIKKNYILSHHNSEIFSRTTAIKHEIYNSMPLVKAFSTEKRAVEKLIDVIRLNFTITNEMMAFGVIEGVIRGVIPLAVRFIVFLFGVYWIIKGQWELGSLYAFQSYMTKVSSFPDAIINSIKEFQNRRVTLERMSVLFEAIPEDNINEGIKAASLKGEIQFRDVSFYYQKENYILKNMSFKVRAGEHWAIIGASGIGKSTLISQILRFYKPQNGTILYDGKDASEYNIRSLRRRIGYVAQKTDLMSGTIIENIKYGNHEARIEDVIEAARAANIHDFIKGLPEGYESFVGEHGVNLSEGQKQRISIARALVRNPDILIFDEPTSALDNVTENSIYDAIPEYLKNRTTFTIAHRLSTIQAADKILLLADENRYYTGNHEMLIKDNKLYRNFFLTM